MATLAEWQQLATALRELHRALMERGRRDYEREHLVVLTPGELLQLLTTDAYFEWLRPLSELMADIDLVRDADPQVEEDLSGAVRAAVEHLITPPRPVAAGNAFAQRFWSYVQDEPQVAIAYADVKGTLAQWPAPGDTDAAALLHERHVLAEKARHRVRDR